MRWWVWIWIAVLLLAVMDGVVDDLKKRLPIRIVLWESRPECGGCDED